MNTTLFFRITAAVISLLTVFSCSKEIDELIDQPTEPDIFTLSIKASKGEFTKALELSGNTLNAIWDGSETVYVFKNDTQIGELTPDLSTLVYPEKVSCTLAGPFTTIPEAGDVLTLKLTSNNYSGQDGTLDFIAGHCDYAVATLNVTGVNNGQIESTEGSAHFENQQAIVKFTLLDKVDGTTLLTPTTLTVNDGNSDIATATIPAATYTKNGSGVLYVAIPPVAGKTLTLTATVGAYDYVYTKDAATFAQGQYYTISVKMQRKVVLSALSADFVALNGDILTGTSDGTYGISIASGATVTLEEVDITGKCEEYDGFPGITCIGDATILLSGTNSVKGGALNYGNSYGNWSGIFVPYEKTLTIDGTGSLDARSGGSTSNRMMAPGIGANKDDSGGSILITGSVNVTATGGRGSAGIGSGDYSSCDNITITGSANVTAQGGSDGGAGIGSSGSSYSSSSCGNITISTTGTVTATGGELGAGIGTGYRGSCGNITISNGTVTATGGRRSAGIGAGEGEGGGAYCENITINGGIIRATGGTGAAGIGSGYYESYCNDIIITDGVTSLTAMKGATGAHCIGIGTNTSYCGIITIDSIEFELPDEIDDQISDNFEHFSFTIWTTTRTNDTWVFTHK